MDQTNKRNELLERLAQELRAQDPPPGAITARMLADETGERYEYCRRYLNELVRIGALSTFKNDFNQRWYFENSEAKE
jgi:hypothetical protein